MSKYYDDKSYASDAGGLSLDRRMLKNNFPDGLQGSGCFVRFVWMFMDYTKKLEEHLELCDTRSAVVVSLNPMLVATYSNDLDGVAMLKFDPKFISMYNLDIGTRLLTVNSFGASGGPPSHDLIIGPNAVNPHYTNVSPVIAEFVSSDKEKIIRRKREIDESEWSRCIELGNEYLANKPGVFRDGSPYKSFRPAAP